MSEQEKFSPSFDCTVLTDLPLEHIYVPANISRPNSPVSNNGISVSAATAPSIEAVASDANAAPEATTVKVIEEPLDKIENNHSEHSMLSLPDI